ncbi:MAG: type II toxin-antitoxin system VapC family toxin [Acidimicrobiia bacterium]|nr:type II toxin-antitoxin system VapC family toxin [Acidimicrobiia bacterium]
MRPSRGLLDTSVLIDIGKVDPTRLPVEVAISAITLAELAAGPHATQDPHERARRQEHLQRAEAVFHPVPFGVTCARAYGRVFSAVTASGRKPRGVRAVDLLIAATALAEELPLYTRNIGDFVGLEHLLDIIDI